MFTLPLGLQARSQTYQTTILLLNSPSIVSVPRTFPLSHIGCPSEAGIFLKILASIYWITTTPSGTGHSWHPMHASSMVMTELSRKLHSGQLILAYSACHAACTAIPLTMPHNSQSPLSTNTKKNVFNYVLWSMARPMSKENEAIKYHNRFLDLTEPLLNTHWLDDEECNRLF
jgi:hypothetical protein